ncbi:MAG: DHH family phosphoesterase [Eubacterium sp.]|nr:DHH family phosphoesterase [Eubacterium sp.]
MKNFYRDGGLVISVAALVAAMVFLELYVYSQNTNMFWITLPFIVLIVGFVIGKLIQVTRKTVQYQSRINEELEHKQLMSTYSYPLAAVVTDSLDRIIWCNKLFEEEFPDAREYGTSISEITDIKPKTFFEHDGKVIKYNDKVFRVYARVPDEDEENGELTLLFFRNITDYSAIRTEKKLSQPVVMLVMVDGYEELISGCPESEKAHVSVQIDKLLEDFIDTTTGILRKISSDRFVAVIEERHLAKMIEDKVSILDKAREIFVNDRVNVTLSIGIGRTGKTLTESEKIAQQALEMALGRGGDQAAIKTESGFEFYGGVSKGVERQAKVRTRIIAHSLLAMADNSDKIYIMGHKFSDLDSVGSCVGLTCALRNLGKDAHTVCDRDTSLAKELIDLFPAAGQTDDPVIISPAKAIDGITDDTLLIICDTHNPKIIESAELLEKAKKIVVIDHHRRMVNCIENAAIFHHEPYASSASEMVTELLQYFGEAGRLKAYQAECLLAGIMLDTKNFVMRTGVRTFEAAAVLRKLGADTITVKKLFSSSIDSYKRKTQIVADAEIYRQCAIAPCDFYADDLRIVAPQAADELLTISNVDASFVLYRTMNDEVSISARSMGGMNVQLVMEALGGGGHQTMAGVQLKNCSVKQAMQALCQAIDSYYETNTKSEN